MSDEVTISPDGTVKCPNHNCELDGVPFPLPEKGEGRCPVSGAMFTYEAKVDPNLKIQLKDGRIVKGSKWHLTGND